MVERGRRALDLILTDLEAARPTPTQTPSGGASLGLWVVISLAFALSLAALAYRIW